MSVSLGFAKCKDDNEGTTMSLTLSNTDVKLKTDESFLNEVARKTVNLKAGARGLKKTINQSLQPAITEILKEGKYKELIVSGETVNNPKQYILR